MATIAEQFTQCRECGTHLGSDLGIAAVFGAPGTPQNLSAITRALSCGMAPLRNCAMVAKVEVRDDVCFIVGQPQLNGQMTWNDTGEKSTPYPAITRDSVAGLAVEMVKRHSIECHAEADHLV